MTDWPRGAGSAPAVVVGICSHGLAVARALAAEGVTVHALEARPELPGCHTTVAQVHLVPELRGPALIASLLELHDRLKPSDAPVLFLTNDNMVSDVAGAWSSLEGRYRLSWSGTRAPVVRLLSKAEHAPASSVADCNFPASAILDDPAMRSAADVGLCYPLIAKPTRPLSSFKTKILRNDAQLSQLADRHGDAYPIILQQFVEGGDERIHFCAVYLRDGKIMARFDGRKLRSRPMGHTTVAEPLVADDIFEATSRFFAKARVSGPASLELKRAADNRLWVIEPTVGRTDFWVQVCISNGVNLPWIEYCDQVQRPLPAATQRFDFTWVNTERDPKALGAVVLGMLNGSIRRRRLVFPYLRRGERTLALRAAAGKARRNLRSRMALARETS